jgi:AcrR family transcriptional regulator
MVAPARAGLRERKRERLRAEIVDAALDLFAERGFDETTIDDVVRKVDVSRRTFFRYFATKEDVLMEWLEGDRFRLRDAIAARPANETPIDSVRHALAYIAGAIEAERAKLVVIERIARACPAIRARRQEKLARLAREIGEIFASRLGHDATRDMAPRLIGNLSMAAGQAAIDTWIAGGARESLAKLMDEALRFIGTGVLPARQARGVRAVRRA